MDKFKVGDHVEFEDVEMGDMLNGRVLAVTKTEYAVAVPGWGIKWVRKTEVTSL